MAPSSSSFAMDVPCVLVVVFVCCGYLFIYLIASDCDVFMNMTHMCHIQTHTHIACDDAVHPDWLRQHSDLAAIFGKR